MRYKLSDFNTFLQSIDLQKYKDEYSYIKTVEMDLPKNIQALNTIYKVYWDKENEARDHVLSFDEFYDVYYNNCKEAINTFWDKSGFEKGCACFQNGLKARIYRTWASLITQIHAGYVAESVFGEGNIEMSTDLDHKGIDILAHYNNNDIKIQIKKDSKRPEIARMHVSDPKSKNIYNIWYIVPSPHDYENPYYSIKARQGELRDSVKPFTKYNKENGTLDRLNNGFVIFTTKEFELIKQSYDNGD